MTSSSVSKRSKAMPRRSSSMASESLAKTTSAASEPHRSETRPLPMWTRVACGAVLRKASIRARLQVPVPQPQAGFGCPAANRLRYEEGRWRIA